MSRYERLMMFRAAALQGLTVHADPTGLYVFAVVARHACEFADAMMAECDKRDKAEQERNR